MELGDVAAVGVEEADTGVEAGDAEGEDCPAADDDDDDDEVNVALPKSHVYAHVSSPLFTPQKPSTSLDKTTKLTSRLRQL